MHIANIKPGTVIKHSIRIDMIQSGQHGFLVLDTIKTTQYAIVWR